MIVDPVGCEFGADMVDIFVSTAVAVL